MNQKKSNNMMKLLNKGKKHIKNYVRVTQNR